jgi:hypothetical protein
MIFFFIYQARLHTLDSTDEDMLIDGNKMKKILIKKTETKNVKSLESH